jgi:hypothetical protein
MASNHRFFTQKLTGIPSIGQYFYFFYAVWCKIMWVFQKFQQYFFQISNQTQNRCSSCYRTEIMTKKVIKGKTFLWHLNVRVLQKFPKYFFLGSPSFARITFARPFLPESHLPEAHLPESHLPASHL